MSRLHPAGRGRRSPTAATRGERARCAIGGIDHTTLDDVLAAGATRVVVVRAITEADDPAAATAALARRLLGQAVERG